MYENLQFFYCFFEKLHDNHYLDIQQNTNHILYNDPVNGKGTKNHHR